MPDSLFFIFELESAFSSIGIGSAQDILRIHIFLKIATPHSFPVELVAFFGQV